MVDRIIDPELCSATISQLRQELARLRAASNAKSLLIAELGHELGTPLNAILGFSEIIRAESLGPLGNITYRDYIDDIIFCSRHLLSLVNAALDMARHDAGKLELNQEPVSIDELVEDAFRLVAPLAERANVALKSRETTSELPRLYCDRLRVRQILVNILSNAVKFTEPGGQVEIAAAFSDGVFFIVHDTGIGIEPENLPTATASFERAAVDGPSHRPGPGLGLALAKALIEQHGGSLSLQSTPKVGTTVRIWFPPQRLVPDNPDGSETGMPSAL